jgi:uncharacterized membrane protein
VPSDPNPPAPHRRRRGLLATLRGNFLTGLVVIIPIALTLWLIWNVIGWIDGWVLPFVPHRFKPDTLIHQIFGPDVTFPIRGFGVLIFLVVTIVVGWVAKGLIGRSFLRWGESLVDRLPVIRTVYNGLKQITETVFSQSESSFQKVCLVEYPRLGTWAVAFVSTEARGEVRARLAEDGRRFVSVFMPTTPNPTTGFLFYVAEDEIIYLDMTIEEAAKLIISAGLVYPPDRGESAPLLTRRPA